MIIVQCIPSVVMFIAFLLFLPDSPRYLARARDNAGALAVLRRCYAGEGAQAVAAADLAEIVQELRNVHGTGFEVVC